MAKLDSQTIETADDNHELAALAEDIVTLSDTCQVKRVMLWERGNRRTKYSKGLQISAGVIALFSGGAITSVETTLTSSLTIKIVAAALAFLSGSISLVATTLFDSRETERMFDGAAQYALLRDKARALHDKCSVAGLKQTIKEMDQLRSTYDRLTRDFDRLLPTLRPTPDILDMLGLGKGLIAAVANLSSIFKTMGR